MTEAKSILKECLVNIESNLTIDGDVGNHPLLRLAQTYGDDFLFGAAIAALNTSDSPERLASDREDDVLNSISLLILAVIKRRLDDGKALADLPPVPTPSAWGGLAHVEFHTASN